MTYHLDFEPTGRRIACKESTTVFEAACQAGIQLNSICGGKVKCGRCKVRIVSGDVSPIGEDERACLSNEDVAAGFRLACAVRPLSDLKLEVPELSLTGVQRLQLLGKEPQVTWNAACDAILSFLVAREVICPFGSP